MKGLRYGSVCSGIEAATVAWHSLGWEAAWLSEIEAFPSAVLAHHYPDVPNLGDMTKITPRILDGSVEAPDVFVGGTPCQAFSVAGLRNSLEDDRGQLSITCIHTLDAIDIVRQSRGEQPCIAVWENVPGVLSTKDNAFGCFLAGLSGEDDALLPPRGKWTNAGCVVGPKRTVAWRVLDAQYFGVAQRRRRVFVVASAREDFSPPKVLFEFESLRRDTPPSREKGKGTAGDAQVCASDRNAVTFKVRCGCEGGGKGYLGSEDQAMTLSTTHDQHLFTPSMQVRRLTPVECERLQGFPDNYTNIPWRKKEESPDGPRYKALGNSMAVPVMHWIGKRIQGGLL